MEREEQAKQAWKSRSLSIAPIPLCYRNSDRTNPHQLILHTNAAATALPHSYFHVDELVKPALS